MSELTRRIARLRVPLGYVLGAGALWLASPTPRSLAAGAAVGAIGEALRIWAAGHLEKGREVTSSGPYALTRHPLYAGSTIIGAGIAGMSSAIALSGLLGARGLARGRCLPLTYSPSPVQGRGAQRASHSVVIYPIRL